MFGTVRLRHNWYNPFGQAYSPYPPCSSGHLPVDVTPDARISRCGRIEKLEKCPTVRLHQLRWLPRATSFRTAATLSPDSPPIPKDSRLKGDGDWATTSCFMGYVGSVVGMVASASGHLIFQVARGVHLMFFTRWACEQPVFTYTPRWAKRIDLGPSC